MKYSVIGMGFIYDRHVKAIHDNGGEIKLVCDIDESKKDKSKAKFFKNWRDMYLSKEFTEIDYVVICTPNNTHFEMAIEALRKGKKVICEKPPILNDKQYEALMALPNINDLSIMFQARYAKGWHKIDVSKRANVNMNISVHRDDWYMKSWKADDKQSGGLLNNIGCHYFDILAWLFGSYVKGKINIKTPKRIKGTLELENADVSWLVAIDAPHDNQKRQFIINGESINLTQMGFEELHPTVYKDILNGGGIKLKEYKKTLEIITKLYGA